MKQLILNLKYSKNGPVYKMHKKSIIFFFEKLSLWHIFQLKLNLNSRLGAMIERDSLQLFRNNTKIEKMEKVIRINIKDKIYKDT